MSYQFFERTPLLLRVALGTARARVRAINGGRFSGDLGDGVFTRNVAIPEQALDLWLPFVGPEVRIGRRFGQRWTCDIGVAAFWMAPGRTDRVGNTPQSGSDGRNTVITDDDEQARFFALPEEQSLGSFLLFVPSIAVALRL